ncbi:MAG: DUF86 domain-containing protein [Bacteroidales bacterium]|nr:DUF86 domain-containing protein [Bacteroidales bacterium]
MREPIRDKGRLEHILAAIDDATSFANQVTCEALEHDKLHCYALVHSIQIIGEAAYKLTHEFRDNHPEVEWNDIIGMRHILVHDYYRVDISLLWNIVHEELPLLRTQVCEYLQGME